MTTTDLCHCGNTKEWHENNTVRHAYTPVDGPAGNMLSVQKGPTFAEVHDTQPDVVRPMRMPFDPVLRQALMDKGVITIDDLTDAEKKIRFLSEGLMPDG